jgi:hypothetical protein
MQILVLANTPCYEEGGFYASEVVEPAGQSEVRELKAGSTNERIFLTPNMKESQAGLLQG